MCWQSPYSLGRKFRTDHHIHRHCGVAAFPFSKTKDDQLFGEWKRNVGLETLSVGLAADGTRLSRGVEEKSHFRIRASTWWTDAGPRAGTRARKSSTCPCCLLVRSHENGARSSAAGSITCDWLTTLAHVGKRRNLLISGSPTSLNTCCTSARYQLYIDRILQKRRKEIIASFLFKKSFAHWSRSVTQNCTNYIFREKCFSL